MGERERVQLLLWRAGLGATAAQVNAALAPGYAQAVENMLAAVSTAEVPALSKTRSDSPDDMTIITEWWVHQLATSSAPLVENLTLFWHNHFATSQDKVNNPQYMLNQNKTFRALGMGTFVDLLIAVSKDPAMLIWLDGRSNVKGKPNENWAREVMELFTIGIGNYTETDVREAARACTGWTLATDGTVKFDSTRFDSGTKTILGQTGNFGLDDFSSMLAAHPATAPRLCKKLFAWFTGDTPTGADVQPMIDAWNATGGEIRSVLRAMFLSAAFMPGQATTATHFKNPVAWIIGIIRGLGVSASDLTIASMIGQQGMTLFRPPNVGGWPSGAAWISAQLQLLRYNLAGQLLGPSGAFYGTATAAFVQQLMDSLGGIAIPADVQTKLVSFGNTTDGQRAVVQVVLAGPDYQAW